MCKQIEQNNQQQHVQIKKYKQTHLHSFFLGFSLLFIIIKKRKKIK